MELARNITRRLRPPALLRQANSVFACDDAAKHENLGEQFIEGPFRSSPDFGFSVVTAGHDVDVHVAVAGVPEAGDRKTGSLRDRLCESNQVDEPAPGHDNILV